jgi:acetyl esterase
VALDPFYVSRFAEVADVTWDRLYAGDEDAINRAIAFGRPAATYTAPTDVTVRDCELSGPHGAIPVRTYIPADAQGPMPALVWMHGGAFKFGDLNMLEAHGVAAELSHRAQAFVVSVDYRLAPEHQHPVQVDECIRALAWLLETSDERQIDEARIWVGGASAGAVLATSVALELRDSAGPAPRGVLLAYPGMHLEMPEPSPELASKMLQVPPLARFDDPRAREVHYRDYLGAAYDSPPPNSIPAIADVRGLPPVVMALAEYDDLRASGEAFSTQLREACVSLESWTESGTAHGYLNAIGVVAGATRTLTAFARRLSS